MLLANHPEVQDRCFEEQRALFGNSVADAEVEHLSKMPYLEAVVKESLRLYPSVAVVGRKIRFTRVHSNLQKWPNSRQEKKCNFREEDVVDGARLPVGSSAVCFIHLLHRNPEVWSEPDRFIPERFLPGNK